MEKANILITGFLAATMIFAANDARSQSNALAFNGKAVPDTEVSTTKEVPFVAEGTSGQARTVSAHKPAIVLHISGGQDPKYSAEDYARMFRKMFNDPKRTDFPSEIYVRYEESGQARKTAVRALIARRSFDKNGGEYENGDGVFTPIEILKYIPEITRQNAKANGLASVTKKDGQALNVAMN